MTDMALNASTCLPTAVAATDDDDDGEDE